MEADLININTSCRACLKRDCDLESIFNTFHKKVVLSQILMSCVPVYLAENDGLSTKICGACKNKAVQANDFQQMFLTSDIEMRKLIDSEEYIWKVKLEVAETGDENSADSNYDPNFVMVKEMMVSDFSEEEEEERKNHRKAKSKTKSAKPGRSTKNKKSIECKVCFESFISSAKLSKHFISTHKQEVNKLGDIKKSAAKKDLTQKAEKFDIDSHHEMNDSLLQDILGNEVPSFLCSDCPKKFYTDKTLKRHQVIHSELMRKSKIQRTNKDYFHCVICLQKIQSYQDLFVHMRTEHKSSDESKVYECKLCSPSKSFKNFSSIIRHSKIHEENATHQCFICCRRMGFGDDLIVHFLRHEGIRPDELASDRRKKVTKGESMKTLQLVRDPASKKHLCSECGREFTNTDNFKKHLIR